MSVMSVPGVKRPSESQFIADEPQRKKQKQKHDFPFPKGWSAEWAGEKGRNFVYTEIANSTTLTHDTVGVVVRYLQKSDIFGLANLERIAGGKEKLAQLLPGYQPEKPIPEELEHLLQLDLGQLFSRKQITEKLLLKPFAHIEKVSELFSIYWCPKGTTGQIIEDIAKLNGQNFWGPWGPEGNHCSPKWSRSIQNEIRRRRDIQQQIQPHWKTETSADCWILFPNATFSPCNRRAGGRVGKDVRSCAPQGFEFPHLQEALFCLFMKFFSTGQMVPTKTYCQGAWGNDPWVVGPYTPTGPEFGPVGALPGGAFMRRFV